MRGALKIHVVISALVLCSSGVSLATEPKVNASDRNSVKKIDRIAKNNPKKKIVLANMSDCTESGAKDNWKVFQNRQSLDQAIKKFDGTACEFANVWKKNKIVVRIELYEPSPSGDWALYFDYYYRKDGTLLKVSSILNTFHTSNDDGAKVERELYFNRKGDLIKKTESVSGLKKPHKKNNSAQYMDIKVNVIKKVNQFPFWALIEK